MKWYIASDSPSLSGLCMGLTEENVATDIPERVWLGSAKDAQTKCAEQNGNECWRVFGIGWHYAPEDTLFERIGRQKIITKVIKKDLRRKNDRNNPIP
jgi:hypothetical protein